MQVPLGTRGAGPSGAIVTGGVSCQVLGIKPEYSVMAGLTSNCRAVSPALVLLSQPQIGCSGDSLLY